LAGTCPACQAGIPRHASGVLTHLPDTRERLRRKPDVGFAKLAALQPNKPIPNPTSKGLHDKHHPPARQKASITTTSILQYRIYLQRGKTWADGLGTLRAAADSACEHDRWKDEAPAVVATH